MTENRAQGLKALTYWYQQAGLQFKGLMFADVVAYYDTRHPTFIGVFGSAIDDIKQSESRRWETVQAAMRDLAAAGQGRLPHYQDFFNALIGERLSFRWTDAKDVAIETVQDVVQVAKAGLGIYAAVIAVGIIVFFWQAGKNAQVSA
ncbi:MAG: hypothetical protein NDJ89_09605 [Oligoflexia bacterium]|nr:hypothetical protein [Oligoflexia bacterium]